MKESYPVNLAKVVQDTVPASVWLQLDLKRKREYQVQPTSFDLHDM